MVSLRRGYYGTYHEEVVKKTFERAAEILFAHGLDYPLDSHRYSKTFSFDRLDQLFEKALKGLNVLANTYESEEKNRDVKKLEGHLGRIIHDLRTSKVETTIPQLPPITFAVEDASSSVDAVVEEDVDGGLFGSSDASCAPPSDIELIESAFFSPSPLPLDEDVSDEVVQEEKREGDLLTALDHEDPSLTQLIMQDLQEIADETQETYRTIVTGASGAFSSITNWFAETIDETSESSDMD